MEVKNELIALQHELFDFSKRNPLVHVNFSSCFFPEDDSDQAAILKKIHKKSEFYWKEYGLATCLEVHVFIRWSPPQKKEVFTQGVLHLSLLQTCVN